MTRPFATWGRPRMATAGPPGVRPALTTLCLTALVTTLAACDGTSADPTPTSTAPTSATTDPTTSSTAPTEDPKQVAMREVQSLITRYIAFVDQASQDPSKVRPGAFKRWLIDPELTEQQKQQRYLTRNGFTTNGGRTKVLDYTTTKVDLGGANGAAEIRATLCYDYGDVVTYDKNGNDISTGKQLDVGRSTYTVVNNSYPDASAWRISVENIPGKPCD